MKASDKIKNIVAMLEKQMKGGNVDDKKEQILLIILQPPTNPLIFPKFLSPFFDRLQIFRAWLEIPMINS